MGATFSRVKTWADDEVLTYTDLNGEFDNIFTYLTPAGVDDQSTDTAAMQATTDPYPSDTASLATSLEGELHRIRYLLRQITGSTYWYVFPDIVAKTTTYTAALSDRVILCDATDGAWTLTLPTAVGAQDKVFFIKKTDATNNAITIDGNGAETIDGAATVAISIQYDCYAIVSDNVNWHIISEPDTDPAGALPKGYRSIYSAIDNDTDTDHDIEIQIGEWRDASDTVDIVLSSVLTKRIDAGWAAGDDEGGLASGVSLDVNTAYHVFVIYDTADGNVDGGFDTSLTATNLLADSGYEYYRRVGSIMTDASSNIRPCLFMGNQARLLTPVLDVDVADQGTTYVARTITAPPNVIAFGNGMSSLAGAGSGFQIRPVGASDGAVSYTTTPLANILTAVAGGVQCGNWSCQVDGSSQIEGATLGAATTFRLTTEGWYDPFDD